MKRRILAWLFAAGMLACAETGNDDGTDTDGTAQTAVGAPVVDDQLVSVDRNGEVQITLTGSDPDGDSIEFEIALGPAHGELTGEAPIFTYYPELSFLGTDSFSFRATDGVAWSLVGVVLIDVLGSDNQVPVPDEVTFTIQEDTPTEIELTATDPEGAPLVFEIYFDPQIGQLQGKPPLLTYRPRDDYFGVDQFSFTVSDGDLRSGAAMITVDVVNVNDAPVADDLEVTTDEDTPVILAFTGTDVDGDNLVSSLIVNPQYGQINTNPFSYTPLADWNGVDTLSFELRDPSDEFDVGVATITVLPVPDAPRASSEHYAVVEDTPFEFELDGRDDDGDAIEFIIDAGPNHGVYDLDDGIYTPDPDYVGFDKIDFHVTDGVLDSDPATIEFDVQPVNDAPTAPTVGIYPVDPIAGVDDLSCTLDEESVDVDGDDLIYTFTWQVDEVEFTEASTDIYDGDTIPFTETDEGQVWTCNVAVSDGIEITSGFATVTIEP